jgi:hypothetical protein
MPITPHTPRLKDDPIKLADWLEFEALTSDNGVGSLLELARQLGIAGVGDAEDEGSQEPRQFADHPVLDDVMGEIERRSNGCGGGYPFEVDAGGNSITRKAYWADFSYTNLLLISFIDCQHAVHTALGVAYPARLFEAICVVAAENYLGGHAQGAKAFHFGAPRPNGSGFSDALQSLANAMQGRRLRELEPDAEKDDGLDVLAWRPFADQRCNFVCLFGQCATGENWPDKNPQPLQFLDNWLRIETSAVNGVIFVPFTITKTDWTKKSRAVIVFDRCRIASLVPHVEHGASHKLVRALITSLLAA